MLARILCVCLLGSPLSALAVDYYVATDGDNDNPGTKELPWRNIQKAAETMLAGDSVFIREGSYRELVAPINTGAADGYITYQTYPGEEVIIEAPSSYPDYCILLSEQLDLHHLRFNGLTLRGAGWANFYASANGPGAKSHIVIDGIRSEDGGFGIFLDGGVTDTQIINCEVHNNAGGILVQRGFKDITIDNNHVSYNHSIPNFEWGYHNIQVQGDPAVESSGVTISNNHSHHAEVQGISVWYTNHVLLRNNHSHHNGATGIQIESALGSAATHHLVLDGNICEYNSRTHPSETGIWIDDSSDVIVQNNIMRYNEIGLTITGSSRVLVRHNLIYQNQHDTEINSHGIKMREATNGDEGCVDDIIVHNTLFRNGLNSQRAHVLLGLADYLPEMERAVFKNNIATDGLAWADLWVQGLTHTLDYNNHYNSMRDLLVRWHEDTSTATPLTWTEYLQISGQDAHSITTDPLFVNPAEDNFVLDPDSPCIDTGGFLTTTVSSGNSLEVPVEDARYFTDGLGIIDGDEIQVGANEPARVVSIDYSTNLITLDRVLQFESGEGVSYPYYGSRPDMGAFENECADTEICFNDIDDDCDGETDEDCQAEEPDAGLEDAGSEEPDAGLEDAGTEEPPADHPDASDAGADGGGFSDLDGGQTTNCGCASSGFNQIGFWMFLLVLILARYQKSTPA